MKRIRLLFSLLSVIGVLLLLSASVAWASDSASPAAAAQTGPQPRPAGLPTHVIVFRDDIQAQIFASTLRAGYGLNISQVYTSALNGAAAVIPDSQLAALRADPRILSIEPNYLFTTTAQTKPTGITRTYAASNPNLRINGVDDFRVNADVAVIDTGIAQHPDLNRFRHVNCLFAGGGVPCTSGGTDGNGHGTHVGGTIGAIDNSIGVVGVAPGVRLWGVKVLDDFGYGYMSEIIAGVDWVTANASRIEVANMSLGCQCSSFALNQAISKAVAKGIVIAVAAGNSRKDAASFSPANHPDVITVSALADFNGKPGGGAAATCYFDKDDTLAYFSNFGKTIEITAPGVCIRSTYPGGYAVLSGTSMASPHVAGAAAVIIATSGKPTTKTGALNVRQRIINTGNYKWVDDSGDGIKEPLLDLSNTTVYNPK
jgi:subtilisin family serine protease